MSAVSRTRFASCVFMKLRSHPRPGCAGGLGSVGLEFNQSASTTLPLLHLLLSLGRARRLTALLVIHGFVAQLAWNPVVAPSGCGTLHAWRQCGLAAHQQCHEGCVHCSEAVGHLGVVFDLFPSRREIGRRFGREDERCTRERMLESQLDSMKRL